MTGAELIKRLRAAKRSEDRDPSWGLITRLLDKEWNLALDLAIALASQGDVNAGLVELRATNICTSCGKPTEGDTDNRDGSHLCWCNYDDVGTPDIGGPL